MNEKRLRNRVKTLQKKPQPQQRTPEWFKERQTRVTASEAASCFYKSKRVCEAYVKQFNITDFKYKDTDPVNPYATRDEYIIRKTNSFYGESSFKDTPFTLWGKKYEEVATRLYCKIMNTRVIEFGLLPHSRLKWLAASPDGITEDGVMLEIKCPKSRKIVEGYPPFYYWIQVMIQLEVADLDYCDFLECEINEINTEEEFLKKQPIGKQDIGIILQDPSIKKPELKFYYPPIELVTAQDYIDWKNIEIQKNPLLKPSYFIITKYNIIKIQRDKEWFANVKDDIKRTWDLILNFQQNKEEFEKYKNSIYLINNKAHIEEYNKTTCLIDNNSIFCFEESESELDINCEINTSEN